MAIAERTSSGFPMGWVCFAALLLLAVVVLAPLAAMPVTQMAGTGKVEVGTQTDLTDEELEAQLLNARQRLNEVDDGIEGALTSGADIPWTEWDAARTAYNGLVVTARAQLGWTHYEIVSPHVMQAEQAKAPADMDDEELHAELDAAGVEVVVAWDGVMFEWEGTLQEAYAAALAEAISREWYLYADAELAAKAPADMTEEQLQAALDVARREVLSAEDGGTLEERHDALGKHGSLLNELARRRGWDLYANTELAEIATGVKAAVTSGPAVEIPGLAAPVHVAWSHIKERHGFGPFDLLATGPNHQRNCKEGGKVYVYKKAPAPGDTWILGVVWNDVLVTVYEVTRDMLLYYFDQDGCPPGMNNGHDWQAAGG